MKLVFFTNCISPHQMPLAKVFIDCLGVENYRYIYTDALTDERKAMGWGESADTSWCQQGDASCSDLHKADIVMSGVRALDLFEKRNSQGKQTFYTSERWFKPPLGFLRVFVPSYFKMVRRFLRAFASPLMTYLPMGIHAARDMARLCGLFKGDLRCLLRAPKVAFESHPGGAIVPLKEAMKAGVLNNEEVAFGKLYGFVQIPREHWGKVKPQGVYAKMRLWGYFVEPSQLRPQSTQSTQKGCQSQNSNLQTPNSERREAQRIKVLWVGRMLDWKRVDVLVKACLSIKLRDKVELHLYGHGPEENRLRRLAKDASHIYFHDFVPVEAVRGLMQQHDVYVLPSDGGEGWGAVVSEALEEGMHVFGTIEAGATATILSKDLLYKSTSIDELATLLCERSLKCGIAEWTADDASHNFISLTKI